MGNPWVLLLERRNIGTGSIVDALNVVLSGYGIGSSKEGIKRIMKVCSKGGTFSFPRQRKRLAWYVEVLCSRLLQLDQISEDSIKGFWDEVRKKQQELPFPWQRENLTQEAKQQLDNLLRVKKRKKGNNK